MGAIVIRTRYDEGTESAEVATSVYIVKGHGRIRGIFGPLLKNLHFGTCVRDDLKGVKPLIHQSELGTYTKVVPFQEKKFLSLCSIVKTTEWNGLIKIDN